MIANISSSQSRRCKSINIVREAFVGSVTCTPPPVPARQIPYQPSIDRAKERHAALGIFAQPLHTIEQTI